MLTKHKILPIIKKAFQILLLYFGAFTFLLLIISFTRIPYDVHVWLGTKGSSYKFKPDYIIFLGGSGMPSGSNLVRIYYTSRLAEKYPASKIIIAHPVDKEVIGLIRDELLIGEVDSMRIYTEDRGTNTREQALSIANDFKYIISKNVLLVTSPENMLRSVKAFHKVGFTNVGGEAAFENAMFVDLKYDHKKLGGKKYTPDISSNLALRYNFWNYLKLEITCLREFAALAYYKLNGWI